MNWKQLKQSSLEDIMAWAETQPWRQSMSDCVQDAEWHSEGDVWTHTKMVLEQLLELEDWPSLKHHEQIVLIFTALFHDVAKPLTTEVDPESGRVRSPKHAVKGEHVARNVLRDLGCDLGTREEIARMVRYHGRPAFLLEREEPTHEVVRLSWLVNNRLLYLFALADTRGRDTDSMTRPEENLHFWKLMAEEAGCYDQSYPFATDHARFTFFRQSQPNLHYVPHEEFACTVTLMRAAARTHGSPETAATFRLSRWMTFVMNSMSSRLTIRGRWRSLPKNAVGNCSEQKPRSFSTPQTRCGRPMAGGSTCLPITTLALRSSTSNHRWNVCFDRTSLDPLPSPIR